MRPTSFRLSLACGVLGLILAVLGAALVASRRSTEQSGLDRTLATTAREKAARVETELERMRALALLTARIPPFAELYAEEGSKAAAIAAVAGPGREINEALLYLWSLYPARIVEAGYVDLSGAENARVVRGHSVAAASLSKDVRRWPSFPQGVATPVGTAKISEPFISPTAGVEVVAATAPVAVDGRMRAYVELDLSMSAIRRVLSSQVGDGISVAVVDRGGEAVTEIGKRFSPVRTAPKLGLHSVAGWRMATYSLPNAADRWFVVAAAPSVSGLTLAGLRPAEGAILGLAVLLLAAASAGSWRARRAAAEDLAEEQRARIEAERLSRIDPLTGLFNRRHAMETVEHELARSGRDETALGLLMFDIDHFKRVNDARGHVVGDAVLVEVARRLRAGVREWDLVARIGGEEFCVIAPGIESEAAVAELGDRLRIAVAERPIASEGGPLPVTVSVGAALLQADKGSAEHAIDCADRALYAAKRRGRNRLCRFSQLDPGDLRAEQPQCLHLAEALAVASDVREGMPLEHSREVADLAAAIAHRLGLSEDEILRARLGGWLHDIGKAGIPDEILTKRGPLTEAEWEIVRTHPVTGDELLLNFPELAAASAAVRHHHERFDGGGYPDGLARDVIPIEARIVAAADAYSAMTSSRPYQPARSEMEALEELRRCAGGQFDPRVVAALLEELGAGERHTASAA